MQHYPLAPSCLGEEHLAILENINASTALSFELPALVDVHLEPDNLAGGWKVKCSSGYLGYLSAAESADFPQLERIKRSHMHPSTWCSIDIVDGTVEVAVHLGLGQWNVPRNSLPADAVLLAPQNAHLIHTGSHRIQGSYQFFVALRTSAQGQILAFPAEASAGASDAMALGTVSVPPGYLPALLQAHPSVCARAYTAAGITAVDLPEEALITPPPPALADSTPVTLSGGATAASAGGAITVAGTTVVKPAPDGHRDFAELDG